ncbi:hypothetical protein P3H15_32780 [Rhodococcus sp. T2V]|uniref:hypothetical protein n=1 Tax=Rhodococcus sp. T2V TaxID=3034164 RepID=UPI0023E1E5D5|nr:hypothetical protein [Rhodococcus sp. T2V]MDF3309796.1 hypothetical protein [Rhodococcus sp. T2V]
MNPSNMPGAAKAKARRRVLVRYEYGTGGPIRTVIGRPLVDANSEGTSVYLRRGLLELIAEWPHTNDCTVNGKYIVETQFINPHAPIAEIVSGVEA